MNALAGLLSPTHIKRDIPSCIDCGKCAKACPALLPVNQLLTVRSNECTLCLECVESCPVSNTLGIRVAFTKRRVWPTTLAWSIVGIFLITLVYGRLSGHWQSSVTPQQLAQKIQDLQITEPQHPRRISGG